MARKRRSLPTDAAATTEQREGISAKLSVIDSSKLTVQDLRYALRLLARSPGFTAVAVLTLALGIGANTAVFSIIEGALLRPLPYREPHRLVAVWDHSIREGNLSKIFDSYHDFEEWSRQSRTLEDVTAATWAAGLSRTMTGRGPAREVLALPVSESFFPLLGVSPELGRGFLREDLTRGCRLCFRISSGAPWGRTGRSWDKA